MKASKKEENQKINIYTDLAIECKAMLEKEENEEIAGVKIKKEKTSDQSIRVTWVEILNETGVEQMQKPQGNYITIESEAMKENDTETHEAITEILSEKLKALGRLKKDSVVLIIGLGNWHVTPDALGPKVISKVLVTRHIADSGAVPEALLGHVRPVCAVSPGVMGITGIETAEIVKGIVERVKPDLLLAIDALAARHTSRINATIQMSDTGVNPGAGMGNKRMALNEETMGIPVIAIGVPTVVDAATLVNDTMDMLLDSLLSQTEKGSPFYEMLKDLETEEKYHLISHVLNPYMGNMFVTPKEVDSTIERLSGIIANAINVALHPGIEMTDLSRYIQ